MSVTVSALMCHAPIVIPDVVGDRGLECAHTTRAMRKAAERIVAAKPDVVVLVSPHAPRASTFALYRGDRITGDFGAFAAPSVALDFPAASSLRHALAAKGYALGVDTNARGLDHGAAVPLFFLQEAGYHGPVVVAALPRFPTRDACYDFGNAVAACAQEHHDRVAFIASGDCSHRLIPDAPAGFDPRASDFDKQLATTIASGNDRALFDIDESLRDLAAEDVVDSVAVAAAFSGFEARGREVLSYEGPYGVGYLVAILDDADGAAAIVRERDDAAVLLDVARDSLTAFLGDKPRTTFDTAAIDAQSFAGAFVTWRERNDDLRGCVGRMTLDGPLSDVVAELAIKAATEDPRFLPVGAPEVPALQCEISLLSPSELCDRSALDPKTYGVEVACGWRRGVLLPDIDGVESVDDQVAIALKKAGIAAHEPYSIKRFRVRKVT